VNADLMPDIQNHPQTRISTTPILRVHYISLDMRSAPFDKKAARQAANYAIDKQSMIQKMMAGLGQQVATVVQPAAFGFDPEVKPYPYDPKKAKELLAEAGYPNGVDITLHSSSVDWRPHFEALGQMLTEVGLRTTVKMWDPGPAWNKFFQAEGKATNGQYGNWGNYSVFDADAVLHPLYHTEPGGWIGKHYARVEGLDKLIDEARSSVDQPKRKQIYARIQSMIREEAPSVFLYTQNDTLGISKKVAYEARPDASRGEFGKSFFYREPAFGLVIERMPTTLALTCLAVTLALAVALPVGIYSAVRRNTVTDHAATVVVFLGQSMPVFWIGIMLMLLFAVQWRLLPVSGWDSWSSVVLPSVTLGAFTTPLFMRIIRASMLEVIHLDYVRTARAKGVS